MTRRPLLLWGFGPLMVAAVIAVLMVVLTPSVAPEEIVIRDVTTTTSTSTSTTSTTSTTVAP